MCASSFLTIQFFHSNEGANIAYQLKEASEIDANATPPTIGRRDKTTQGVGSCMAIHVPDQDQENNYLGLCTFAMFDGAPTEDKETGITSPRNIAESRTEKKGSMALMVCVNDTATFPRLIFVKRLPMVWTIARGRIARSWEIRAH